jgi:hypothetical protein
LTVTFAYAENGTHPAPFVLVSVSRPGTPEQSEHLPAQVDTAADRTVIPTAIAERLQLERVGSRLFEGLDGARSELPLFRVELTIRLCKTVDIDSAGADNEPYILIGRDVLRFFRITLDGPKQRLIID